jgi:hypothetical protein
VPPVIIGAVAATAVGAGAAAIAGTAFTFIGLTGWATIVASVGANLVLGELSSFLTPKPKSPTALGTFSQRAQSQTQQVTQAITSRKLVWGETLTSGPILYATSTENNTYLHIVIALAAHEVQAISEVWLNQDVIPNDALDANGNVISGKYAGNVSIKKHLGSSGQNADTDLVAEVTEWDTSHKLDGIAYIYIRYKKNQTLFPSGLPNAAAVVQGRKIFDSRIGANRWTPNVGLFAYDYLQDTTYGVAADLTRIDQDTTEAAANACEEIVTTAGITATVSAVSASTDILTLDASSSPTLALQRGDRVQVTTTGSLPAGIAAVTNYYVIPCQFQGTPRIQLAASLDNAIDGIPVDITSAGSGTHTITKNAEPRYFGGITDTAALVGNNMSDILTGMGAGSQIPAASGSSFPPSGGRRPTTVSTKTICAPLSSPRQGSAGRAASTPSIASMSARRITGSHPTICRCRTALTLPQIWGMCSQPQRTCLLHSALQRRNASSPSCSINKGRKSSSSILQN